MFKCHYKQGSWKSHVASHVLSLGSLVGGLKAVFSNGWRCELFFLLRQSQRTDSKYGKALDGLDLS